MKRWLLVLGILIILILIGFWLFLLFASNETKEGIYNQFGFGGTTEEGIIDTIIDIALPDLEEEPLTLRQLTTKRVAGYSEVIIASSSPQIYFSEAGTGHIYSLNLQTGAENKISNTTIAETSVAKISKDGSFAVLKSDRESVGSLTLITLQGTTSSSVSLPEPALDFTVTDDGQLLYATMGMGEVLGKTFDMKTGSSRTLFTIPLRYVTILWGNDSDTPHYVLPKTTRSLEGYLYEMKDGGVHRTAVSGFGLAALPAKDYIMYSRTSDRNYRTYLHNTSSKTTLELGFPFYPEKCVVSSANLAYCGYDAGSEDPLFPDNWYRGEKSFSDDIWSVNLETLETTLLIDTLAVSGRELDIVDLSVSHDGMDMYFKNKNDHSLWVYDVVNP